MKKDKERYFWYGEILILIALFIIIIYTRPLGLLISVIPFILGLYFLGLYVSHEVKEEKI